MKVFRFDRQLPTSGYEIVLTMVSILLVFLILFLINIEIDYRIAAGLSSLSISITSFISVKKMKIRIEQIVVDEADGIELYFADKNKPKYKSLISDLSIVIKDESATFHEKRSNLLIGKVYLNNKSDDFEWDDFLHSFPAN
jgi:hypothetical protein